MRNFIVKCMLLILVLYAGILIGMEKSSDEKKQSSYEIYSLQSPSHINENDAKEIEATLMKNNRELIDEEEKLQVNKDKVSYLSEAGKILASVVTGVVNKVIDVLTNLI
ncbi:hypothetical protein [Lederbergia lenta]|uniref:Uncharacterized protein n=1 Tax=Lederbergia lenta TaxID=1467 RepID=A0A2X4Z5F9_LEDLE|nr:hypothetical protein [Lederbergia lenta]MEC2325253.1 hypothetical protein [Lederbergia lenta]SQI55884.1 Uncharacterised protein [Lederbergia lenta]